MLVVGAMSFVVFVVVGKRFARIPMIPLHLFGQASTTVIYIQSGLYNLVWQVALYFLPVYFQDVRGYSLLQSATLVLPLLLLQSVAGVHSGPLMTKLARYVDICFKVLFLIHDMQICSRAVRCNGALDAWRRTQATLLADYTSPRVRDHACH